MDGVYQPVTIVHTDETHHWGHSEVLNLDICWEDGVFRWWDPVGRRYLRTDDETDNDRIIAEVRADNAEAQAESERQERFQAEAQAERERQERLQAEARAQSAEARNKELEEELRRQRDQ